MARELTVVGQQIDRFGRIVLTFDKPTKVQARTSSGVLVISFGEPVQIKSERLATEVGRFVSAVRRDPDNTGLRLALGAPVRVNVMEAGERVFVDLLPQNWTGMLPGLPKEVVAELAERARVAEAKLNAVGRRGQEAVRSVRVSLAVLPSLTRLVFEPPAGTVMRSSGGGAETALVFDGNLTLETGSEKPKTAPGVGGFDTAVESGALRVTVAAADGYAVQASRDGDALVVDLAKPNGQAKAVDVTAPGTLPRLRARPVAEAKSAPAPTPAALPASAGAETAPSRDAAGKPAEAPRSEPVADRSRAPVTRLSPAEQLPVPASQPEIGTSLVRITPTVTADEAGSSILFPFRLRTPAAAYEHNGTITLVFENRDLLEAVPGADRIIRTGAIQVSTEDGLAVVRMPDPKLGPVRLVPEGTGWRLWFKGGSAMPPDALKSSRSADENGHALLVVTMPGAGRVIWLREPDGLRVAVATSVGRSQSVPLPRQFVEFDLPATIHGVVVEAKSDDVTVGLGQGGVVVTREAGLSLSSAARTRLADGEGGGGPALIVNRDAWTSDVSGTVLEHYYTLIAEVAAAPRSGRAQSRFRLSRFLVANDLNHEAASVLALASSEDAVFAHRRDTVLLSGIAAVRSGRASEGRDFLSAEVLNNDPEAILWRAVADADEHRWPAALAGFQRSAELLDSYPDELAGRMRLSILRAAIETGDLPRAQGELASIDRLNVGSIPREEHDLARAWLDEASGRTEAALKAYEKLRDDPVLKISAEATLRWVRLASKTGLIKAEDAIDRLEVLSVSWRGGEIELRTIAELSRHYAAVGRWRDLFAMTRRASRLFPTEELTRELYDQAAHLLEGLLLGSDGEQLSAVQALGLYFDFKELAPIGRRGDEIVRRLADRLVELDLLDQAADLLQYQVDNRLTGAIRATVAARLATIRLMSAKPLMAVQALQQTRFSGLPDDVRHFRQLLEARAQADLSRPDLALEMLEGETNDDAARLRASILWSARRWREAGEAAEALAGTRWAGPEPLSDRDRASVVRAALAYGLADERLALDRLAQKFQRKMLDSPDSKMFEMVLRPGAAQTRQFRDVMGDVTRRDTLRDLLTDWRSRHPELSDGAAGEASARTGADGVKPATGIKPAASADPPGPKGEHGAGGNG